MGTAYECKGDFIKGFRDLVIFKIYLTLLGEGGTGLTITLN